MNRLQSFIARIFKIEPARDRTVTIIEPHTFRENVLRNKIWYRGDSAELEQYFQKTARWDVEKARFWAAHAQGNVRKMHSGIVGTVVDRYKDIVLADMDSIDFGENQKSLNELWDKLYEKSKLNDVIGEAITGALAAGDGAFKITADSCSEYPIVEFYDAENVDYVYVHSKLQEIKFYTTYKNGKKDLRLEETYGHGYIKYKLYDDYGKEVPLNQLPETAHLYDLGIEGNIMLTVPLKILVSTKYKNRGKALFEGKTDVLDGLDEVISQWMDAIRMGRIKRYIPDNLIPRDPDTGELMPANPFDNDFIALGDNMGEKANQQVEISQPQISYEAYVNSYINFLDMVLQGIMSPSTLGIDLKKTDNAKSQREKEKVTLSYPARIRDIVLDACRHCRVDCESGSIEMGNYIVKIKPEGKVKQNRLKRPEQQQNLHRKQRKQRGQMWYRCIQKHFRQLPRQEKTATVLPDMRRPQNYPEKRQKNQKTMHMHRLLVLAVMWLRRPLRLLRI